MIFEHLCHLSDQLLAVFNFLILVFEGKFFVSDWVLETLSEEFHRSFELWVLLDASVFDLLLSAADLFAVDISKHGVKYEPLNLELL